MYKYNLLLFTLSLMISINISQCQPIIQWQKCFGGSNDDMAQQIQKTNDDGFIIGGTSKSKDGDITDHHISYDNSNIDNEDWWIIKLDSLGNIKSWKQSSLGGFGNDGCNSIQQTSDGNYIIAGYTKSNDEYVVGVHTPFINGDMWIVKYNFGITNYILWQKCLGGSGGDYAQQIQQTNDGGYIIAGGSQSNDGDVTGHHGSSATNDWWIVKLNSLGNIIWQKSLGGSNDEFVTSIQQTKDKGFIVTGLTYSNDGDVIGFHGNEDCWVVKLDSLGEIKWQKALGGSNREWGMSIQQTNDGGYIIGGRTNSSDGDLIGYDTLNKSFDTWIIKLDSLGNIDWQKKYGGNGSEMLKSILQTKNGDFIVSSVTNSTSGDISENKGGKDIWIVKLNSSGEMIYEKTFGGRGNDEPSNIIEINNNEYIIAGYTNSIDGDIQGNHGSNDYLIIKFTDSIITNNSNNVSENNIYIYPNPAKEYINIKSINHNLREMKLYNINGEVLYKQITNKEIEQIDISRYPLGIMYIKIFNDSNVEVKKIIKN